MKTNLVKGVSVFGIFALAMAGAFASNAKTRQAAFGTQVPGYIKQNPAGTVCTFSRNCQPESSDRLCKVNDLPAGAQLYGMDADGHCTIALWRYVP